jgi:hypothetical protein
MSWFSRKPEPEQATPTDVEVIRTKLAECAAQIEAAERDRVKPACPLLSAPTRTLVRTCWRDWPNCKANENF